MVIDFIVVFINNRQMSWEPGKALVYVDFGLGGASSRWFFFPYAGSRIGGRRNKCTFGYYSKKKKYLKLIGVSYLPIGPTRLVRGIFPHSIVN